MYCVCTNTSSYVVWIYFKNCLSTKTVCVRVCECVWRKWKGRGGVGKGGEGVLTIRNANYSIPSLLVPCILIVSYIFSNFLSPLRNFISSSSEMNFHLFFHLYSQIIWITYICIYAYIHTDTCVCVCVNGYIMCAVMSNVDLSEMLGQFWHMWTLETCSVVDLHQ